MDAYDIIEKVKKEGKIEKGTNEVTKAIERGVAKAVIYAADVEPKRLYSIFLFYAKKREFLAKKLIVRKN